MKIYKYLIITFLFAISINTYGQVFEKIYRKSLSIVQTNDSSLLCIYGDSICNINQNNGQINWAKSLYGSSSRIIKGEDDSYYVVGTTLPIVLPTNVSKALVLKINKVGDTIWTRTFGVTTNSPFGRYFNGLLYVGYYSGNQYSYLYSIDSLGNTIDSIQFGTGLLATMTNKDKNPVLVFLDPAPAYTSTTRIIKLDTNLIVTDTIINNYPVTSTCPKIEPIDSGYVMISGKHLLIVNSITDTVQFDTLFSSSYYFDFVFQNDSIIIITGEKAVGFKYDVQVTVFDLKNKNILLSKVFGSQKDDIGYQIIKIVEGDLVISGVTSFNNNVYDGYMLRLDTNLSVNPCSIDLRIQDNLKNTCLGSKVYIHNSSFGLGKIYTWVIAGDTFYNNSNDYVYTADSLGLIEVKLINCLDTVSRSFLVIDTLIPPFTYGYFGDSIEFVPAPGNKFKHYRWDFGDGNFTLDSIAHHKYNNSGTYVVSFQMSNDYCYIHQYDTLSISLAINNDNHKKEIIDIYPNPSKTGVFRITSSRSITNIVVFNMLGETIPFDIINNKVTIRNNIPGVYFIEITNDKKERFIKKLIIN